MNLYGWTVRGNLHFNLFYNNSGVGQGLQGDEWLLLQPIVNAKSTVQNPFRPVPPPVQRPLTFLSWTTVKSFPAHPVLSLFPRDLLFRRRRTAIRPRIRSVSSTASLSLNSTAKCLMDHGQPCRYHHLPPPMWDVHFHFFWAAFLFGDGDDRAKRVGRLGDRDL